MLFIFHLITTNVHSIACRESGISADLKLQRFSSSLAQSCQQCSLHCMHSSVTDLLIPVYDVDNNSSLFSNHSIEPIIAQPITRACEWGVWPTYMQIEFVWLHLPNCFLMSNWLRFSCLYIRDVTGSIFVLSWCLHIHFYGTDIQHMSHCFLCVGVDHICTWWI